MATFCDRALVTPLTASKRPLAPFATFRDAGPSQSTYLIYLNAYVAAVLMCCALWGCRKREVPTCRRSRVEETVCPFVTLWAGTSRLTDPLFPNEAVGGR